MRRDGFDPERDFLIAKMFVPNPYSPSSTKNFITVLATLVVECFNWEEFDGCRLSASWMLLEDGESLEITVFMTDGGPSPLRTLWVFPKLLGDGGGNIINLDELLGGSDDAAKRDPKAPPGGTLRFDEEPEPGGGGGQDSA